jgi:hypothetical protein
MLLISIIRKDMILFSGQEVWQIGEIGENG